jgi:plasmid stabilization system protein ParE
VKVVWSLLAEQRAIEAVEYIARDRPNGAAEWLETGDRRNRALRAHFMFARE